MGASGSTRLSGWKEIAAYLDVTVRTAQLWEKHRGLPIHRLPGGGKPSVFASTEELERWLHRNPDQPAADAQRPESSPPRRAGRLRFAAILVVALLLSVFGVVQIPSDPSTLVAEVETCRLSGPLVQALDATNGVVWQWRFPDMFIPAATGRYVRSRCLVEDVDDDGRSEIVFLYRGNDRYRSDARVICVSPGVKHSRWEHPIGRRLSREGRVFSAAYLGRFVRPVEIRGVRHLVVVSRHSPSYPAEVALLDARSGALVDRYEHPGHLETMALGDFDLDGSDELLLGGINNPGPGPGRPVLVLLDLPFSGEQGQHRRTADFFGNPGPRELVYVTLPRSDADEATGVQADVVEVGVSDDGAVSAVVGSRNGRVTYTLDLSDLRHPRITGATAHGSFQVGHDALTDEGKLDHYLPTELPRRYYELAVFDGAPDGNRL
jgi:hypothetical protein